MAQFCGKCGSRLDPVTGLCPGCSRRKRNRRILIAGVSVIILMSALWGVFALKSRNEKPAVPDNPSSEEAVTVENHPLPSGTEDLGKKYMLMADFDTASNEESFQYNQSRTICGNALSRDMIESITFLNSQRDAPETCWDVSEEADGSVVAWAEPVGGLYALSIAAEGGVCAPENCSYLFADYMNLKEINFNGAFSMDGCTTTHGMFYRDSMLETLDLSWADTSRVTDMQEMFTGCSSLSSLNIDNFDTSAVKNMRGMFTLCESLTELDISHFNTAKVADMSFMFFRCWMLSGLDFSGWDTSSVEEMAAMFQLCESIETLDLQNFDTSAVENMTAMFSGCGSLKYLNVSSFDASTFSCKEEFMEHVGLNYDPLPEELILPANLSSGSSQDSLKNLTNMDAKQIVPGALITFGAYEQDNNVANGAEPIEWIVLAREDGRALLISTLGLETYPYASGKKTADWSSCFIREWLNSRFYDSAFSDEEKACIALSSVVQHKNKGYPACEQGDNTEDYVFLLSAEEYMTYLHDNPYIDAEYRCGNPSDYARNRDVDLYNDKYCWWWLRTSSRYNETACNVSPYGELDYGSSKITTTGDLIRPAIWLVIDG